MARAPRRRCHGVLSKDSEHPSAWLEASPHNPSLAPPAPQGLVETYEDTWGGAKVGGAPPLRASSVWLTAWLVVAESPARMETSATQTRTCLFELA